MPRITGRLLKRITIVSAVAAIIFFAVAAYFYLLSADLDFFLVIAIAIGILPSGIASVIHNRWKKKVEKAMPEFLRDLSMSMRTGVTLNAALEQLSKRYYGPLTEELRTMVAHMSWGRNFDQALQELSDRVEIPLVKKATVLILEAGKHGGDLSAIFESTARFVESTNTWTLRRASQTLPYVAIFYFSTILFLFIVIIIAKMIFLPLSEMAQTGGALIKPILTPLQARRVFLHTSLMESLFGGIIAGKINEDSFYAGLKHVAILSIASGLAFWLFFW